MNVKEAKKLKEGERVVIWPSLPERCEGTVIETGYSAIKIKWDDGQIGIVSFRSPLVAARMSGGDLANIDRI